MAENARQRDEIESLRVERNRFDTLYKKLEKELSQLQKKKGELIENSTQAYDARYYFLSTLMFSKYGEFFVLSRLCSTNDDESLKRDKPHTYFLF